MTLAHAGARSAPNARRRTLYLDTAGDNGGVFRTVAPTRNSRECAATGGAEACPVALSVQRRLQAVAAAGSQFLPQYPLGPTGVSGNVHRRSGTQTGADTGLAIPACLLLGYSSPHATPRVHPRKPWAGGNGGEVNSLCCMSVASTRLICKSMRRGAPPYGERSTRRVSQSQEGRSKTVRRLRQGRCCCCWATTNAPHTHGMGGDRWRGRVPNKILD